MNATSFPSTCHFASVDDNVSQRLSLLELGLLGIGIFEIPLQIDKYFMYHVEDAALGAVAGVNVSMTTFCIVALYGIWFSRCAALRQATFRKLTLGVPMLIYLCTIALSAMSATKPMLSMFDLILVSQAYLLFFYIANRVRTVDDVVACIVILALTLSMQSCIIIGLAGLGIDDQEITIGPLVLAVAEGKRHAGSLQSPVLAGSTMALIWLPIAALALCPQSRWVSHFLKLTTMIGLLAILLTQTRGAILTSVVGSAIIGTGLFVRGWLPKWTLAAAACAAILSIYPLLVLYEKRIEQGDGESAIARKHLSLIALELISDRPIFGFGAGNCHLAGMPISNQSKYRGEWYYTIHSKYLLVWIETGLIGLLAFMTVLANGMRQGLAAWMTRRRDIAPIGLALAAALAGHGLHMAVDVFNSRIQVQVLWTILGIVAAVYRISQQPVSQPRKLSRSLVTQRRRSMPAMVSAGGYSE